MPRLSKNSRFALLAASTLALQGIAGAQLATYVGSSGGGWGTSTNWNIAGSPGVPGASNDVRIDNSASNVIVNTGAGVTRAAANVTIDAGDVLHIDNNTTVNVGGNLLVNGTLNFGSNPNESFLNFSSPTATITGTGGIDFTYIGGSPTAGVIQGPSSGSLTNNTSIRGAGTLRSIRFNNSATGLLENYDSGAQLYLDANNGGAGLFVNSGTIRALTGATVTFSGDNGGDFVSTGGNIQANGAGAIVRLFNSASITGGVYSTTGGGEIVVEAGQTGNVSPQSLSGTWRLRNNSTLNISGTMTNNGAFQFSPTGSSTTFNLNGALTLNGTGGIVGNYTGSGGGPNMTGGANLLTLGANQTVSGVVSFSNMTVTNNGLIDANDAVNGPLGSGIYIDPYNGVGGAFINNGTMRASNSGGVMAIVGDNGGDLINNGTIAAIGNNSLIKLQNNVSVTGGTFSTTGTGLIRVEAGHTANLGGTMTLTTGSTMQISNAAVLNMNGTLTNNGTLKMLAAGNTPTWNLNGPLTLSGTGSIIGVYPGTAGGPNITGNTQLLTLGSGQTVSGVVSFTNMKVTNNGLIDANDASNGTLNNAGIYIDPNNQAAGLFVNNGTMRASNNGGVLVITGDNGGDTINNGTIASIGALSKVELYNSASVTGGLWTGDGIMRVRPGHTGYLSGPTIAAGALFQVPTTGTLSTTLVASGAMTLNGTLRLDALGQLPLLSVPAAGLTLSGSGTLLGAYSGIPAAPGPRIDASSGSLVIGASNTVRGVVYFNNVRATNNGLIDADNAAGMYVDPNNQAAGLFINNNVMRSSSGGLMQLTGDGGGDFVNNGTISAIGANSITEMVNNISVTGGTWTNSGGGVIRVRPGSTGNLYNPTIPAGSTFIVATTGAAGSTLNASGTINLGGTLKLDAQGQQPLLTTNNGSGTLTGSGDLLGSYIGSGPGPQINTGGNTFTIGASNTVHGVIAFKNVRVNNNGLIDADNAAGIYVDPNNQAGGLFVNNNVMRSSGGGLMQLAGDAGGDLVNNGTISSIGANSITEMVNNISVTGGTWTNSGGGVIRVRPGHTGNLYSPTIAAGSTFTVATTGAVGSTLNATGTFNLGGTIKLDAQGQQPLLTTNNGSGTLAGSGDLLGSYIGSGPGPQINTGGNTLTIGATNTVHGVISFNNVRVTNNGTILADSTAGEMYLDPNNQAADLFVNNGTFRATGGGTLTLAGDAGGNFAGLGPIVADANSYVRAINGCGSSIGAVSGAGTYLVDSSSNMTHPKFLVANLRTDNGGTARIKAGGGTLGTSTVNAYTSANTGRLDVTDHGIVIDYTGASPIATIRGYLVSGFNNGLWNGGGINSSTAAASTFPKGAVGYAEATAIGSPATFLGQGADSTSVLIRYTLQGDANLSGNVDSLDFNALAGSFGLTGKEWVQGDFNYSGNVDSLDFNALAANFGQTLPAAGGSADSVGSVVPEPTVLSTLLLAPLAMRNRRRRTR